MTPAASLAVSREFFRAYERCRGNGLPAENGEPNPLIPSIVCLAFSTELALKSLLLSEGKQYRGHELNLLFDALSPETRADIVTESCISESSFRENLDAAANTFNDWRYIHEQPGTHSSIEVFLSTLHRAVNTVARRVVERLRKQAR